MKVLKHQETGAFSLLVPLLEKLKEDFNLSFVSDCVEQEIIQDDQFPFEILLHLAGIFIVILLFKSYHAFQKFLAVKVTDIISVAGLYADSFCNSSCE